MTLADLEGLATWHVPHVVRPGLEGVAIRYRHEATGTMRAMVLAAEELWHLDLSVDASPQAGAAIWRRIVAPGCQWWRILPLKE